MANELLRLVEALRTKRDAVLRAVPEDHRAAFGQRIDELTAAANERPESEAETLEQAMALLDEYPSAKSALRAAEPGLFPGRDRTPPAAAGFPPPGNGAAIVPPPRRPPASPALGPVGGDSGGGHGGSGLGGRSTIDLQWVRELTATVLALMIVGLTLWMALKALGVVGDTAKAPGVKDLLNALLNLAGVVIGYYFGRVPAEAHAAAAAQRADAAVTDRDRMRIEAHRIADEMDHVERASAIATARGDQAAVGDLRPLRDRLRAL
ncbi:hypothetical protein EV384_5389 [Micromonospora kangleipakensis]|uniref:Uncharacterized protein n=1 Tax=Micromonospora kangleipakensis TaxID=1077942 RepID=A0A4Q8BFH1_9ACTN|nr:hypothetical protein [Micromonospora kangleipakensis]RZU76714.1 hypothetical protein EV384_5389 [Micromonospora kangleipakensis]